MLLPITLTLAAASALFNFWLAMRCSRIRLAKKILHGDGGDALLHRRIRAHANFIEYTPIVLILFALVELALGASTWLWVAALLFILARVGHAFGMDSDAPNIGRGGGIAISWLIMLGLAVMALYAAYTGTQALPVPPSLAAHV